jgi:hypothetical protein
VVEYSQTSKDDLAVSIHGNFSWKLGEKDKDPNEEEQIPFSRRGRGGMRGGRIGRRGGRMV